MATSCLRQSTARAISTSQFLSQFRLAWTESRVSGLGGRLIPRRLGLAVSGGADSMALAYLCKQLERSGLVEDLSVTAFVVDHKAREESSREAGMVARWLGDMDITTKLLELEWNSNNNSNHAPETETGKSKRKGKPSSAFETHARRLRFQALGTACRDNHIETLMMGHHQDDNVETTLWRLATGARGVGLAGIPQVARIPECHGLYGVSGSGGSVTLSRPEPEQEQKNQISTGGISICRPLLSFPKTHILATCHEHHIPFVNDPTNFDPTLTPRNAIRSLLSSNRLPRALAPPSILSLIKTSRALIRDSVDLSNGVLGCCRLLEFNLSSGTMVVQFPSSSSAGAGAEAETTAASIPTSQIQAMALRRITELISPFQDNEFPLRSFEKFTDRVFPSPASTPSPSEAKRQSFTLGGVMFQPLQQKSNRNNANGDDNTWILSRQPFMRHRLPTINLDIPIPSTSTSTSTSNPQNNHHHQQQQQQESTNYTPWTLWDDRYWFRCYTSLLPSKGNAPETESHQCSNNMIPATVIIRPLQQSDLHHLRRSLFPRLDHQHQPTRKTKTDQDTIWTRLMEMLSRNAPNQSRFTIPVLEAVNSEGGGKQLLALPTMDFRFPSPSGSIPEIKWEWMYKMIDHETVKSMGWKMNDGS